MIIPITEGGTTTTVMFRYTYMSVLTYFNFT
jgi:hypothetical protein